MRHNSSTFNSIDQELIEYFQQDITYWQETDVNNQKEMIFTIIPQPCDKIMQIISSILNINQQRKLKQISEHEIYYEEQGKKVIEYQLSRENREEIIIQWIHIHNNNNNQTSLKIKQLKQDEISNQTQIKRKLLLSRDQQRYKKTKSDQDGYKVRKTKEFMDNDYRKCVIHKDGSIILQLNIINGDQREEYKLENNKVSIRKYQNQITQEKTEIFALGNKRVETETEIISKNELLINKYTYIGQRKIMEQSIIFDKAYDELQQTIKQFDLISQVKLNYKLIIQRLKDKFGQSFVQKINLGPDPQRTFFKITYEDDELIYSYKYQYEEIHEQIEVIKQTVKYRNGVKIIREQENQYEQMKKLIFKFKDKYGNQRISEKRHGQFMPEPSVEGVPHGTMIERLQQWTSYDQNVQSLIELQQWLEENPKIQQLKQKASEIINFQDAYLFQKIDFIIHNQQLKYKIDCQKKEFKKIFQRKLLELFQDN